MTHPNDQEIESMLLLWDGTTPGPWRADRLGGAGWRILATDPRTTIVGTISGCTDNPVSTAEALAIAEARTAMPRLCRALLEARTLLREALSPHWEARGWEELVRAYLGQGAP